MSFFRIYNSDTISVLSKMCCDLFSQSKFIYELIFYFSIYICLFLIGV